MANRARALCGDLSRALPRAFSHRVHCGELESVFLTARYAVRRRFDEGTICQNGDAGHPVGALVF
jgi:hypothetical protein